jgi:alkylated DNA repair dioxygenase AlkB
MLETLPLPLYNPFQPQKIPLQDGELLFVQKPFCPNDSHRYFNYLLTAIPWRQETIVLFGKRMQQPRLTAWYADEGKTYTYSGLKWDPQPWCNQLLEIKRKVEIASSTTFNSVLLNLYRNGNDSMGWHSDDEKELGANPVIASLSLGGSRKFQMRHKIRTAEAIKNIELQHGNLIIMRGATQQCWKHQIPKTKKIVEPRINLTFRNIV